MTRSAHALEIMEMAVSELQQVADEMKIDSAEVLLARRGVIRHIEYIRESMTWIKDVMIRGLE